ncbi:ASCH domain-containing protein [Streptococcus ictaluri]|uniref:ASCH domain protein n=1 Tax=Streptococcus ictaluri 707-05 TaxID=764299 RepID=G5K1L8_9STRE|nr:ASCH domain-containing protein [Streptococcus ictaluri]EHI70014.1 ASCH domain protein [Streptococcus ictaluri 707-05]
MTAEELWKAYQTINPEIGDEVGAWAFGAKPDELADLVLKGIKTATASAYDLYQLDQEALPQVGTYDVILNGKGEGVCIVQLTKVSIVPFDEVSAEHAYKEGEDDRTLDTWRQVHQVFFEPYFKAANLVFNQNSMIVLEEFKVVYPTTKR